MKLEKKIIFKCEIDNKEFSFTCDEQAKLGVIWDALHEMMQVVTEQINQHSSQENPTKQQQEYTMDEVSIEKSSIEEKPVEEKPVEEKSK